MTDLVSWLTAQLDHDEQVARAAMHNGLIEWPGGRGETRSAVDDGAWTTDGCEVDGVGIRIYDEGGHSEEQAAHIALHDPASVLRTVAAHRAILAEHLPTLRTVEWPHDTTGKGEALACPRCQNAEHTDWNPPIGMAGVLPEGFVAPYVLAPCRTLLMLAAIYSDREGWDPSWQVEE